MLPTDPTPLRSASQQTKSGETRRFFALTWIRSQFGYVANNFR